MNITFHFILLVKSHDFFFQLDHFGPKDGVEWHEYFTAINDDMSNYYAQVAKEKIKTDQKFKKRLRDLISEAKTKDLF